MDKLIFGLGVSVLGMVTVFVGLIILIVFISILSKFSGSAATKKKAEPKQGAVKPAAGTQEVSGEVMVAITAALSAYDGAPSPDVVAAIAAALNVVMGEGKFVVKHIKRIKNAPAWNRAGREEQIYSRF